MHRRGAKDTKKNPCVPWLGRTQESSYDIVDKNLKRLLVFQVWHNEQRDLIIQDLFRLFLRQAGLGCSLPAFEERDSQFHWE